MTQAQIRFSTNILRRLGEELNPSPDQGILELVKNSYDADARKCIVKLINIAGVGGRVEVVDDGNGMNAQGITENWLVLGQSPKSKTQRTQLGRIPAGSKGLGRLAALRMGKFVTLQTRPKVEPDAEYQVRINWSAYDDAKLVEDVELDITRSVSTVSADFGTTVVIDNLQLQVSRMDVKRLARAMILLADPFKEDPEAFQPILEAPEFRDMERLVQNRYFEQSDYHLIATIGDGGMANVRVVDWKGETLYEADHKEIAVKHNGKPYACPPTTFDLWVFLLEKSSFVTKTVSIAEVRAWLEAFGGVHLYENGLRVQPYGNPGNDWLDMNLRRARSPEERPSTNTTIGRVALMDTEGLFTQKTDRSGFIESESFLALRTFAQDALDWMAKRRLEAAELRRIKNRQEAPTKSAKSKVQVEQVIGHVQPKLRAELQQVFASYDKQRQREVDEQKREIQLYRTLSTAGITAATFAHESSGNPIKVIIHSIGAIERRALREMGTDEYAKHLERPVTSIKLAVDSLSVLGSATLRLLDNGKRRIGRVNIHDVVGGVVDTFKPFFEGRGVYVDVNLAPGNPYLRGAVAAVESIITNLLNNSMSAFESSGTRDRKIQIKTDIESPWLQLSVADSGPGIVGITKRYIWLPGQTTKPAGTGLGLTIVHDAVKDLGGDVDAVEHGALGGAEIIIKFPILGY